jgi:hypothetical protein
LSCSRQSWRRRSRSPWQCRLESLGDHRDRVPFKGSSCA